MLSFFFLIIIFATFTSLGSCPNSMVKSSKDFVLVPLAYEEAFSSSNCINILFSEFCS